ncbi:MAG TPA: hypothetical protein DCQ31_04220 [Bacteroidales bacterium]|nr:hypothetical protein [Bacteroidales bacterium]
MLVFPHPLTVDYYPYHIPLVALTEWQSLLGIAVILALGVVAIIGFRNKSIYAYAVWFYAASFSVVSNLFFSIGTFMNERFIFISSFAFTLVVGYLLAKIINEKFQQKNLKLAAIGLFAVVLGLYGFKTVHRNSQWENEFILFGNDVKVSKNSAFTNNAYGGALIEKALIEKDSTKREMLLARAVSHLSKSVHVFPKFDKAEYLLGNAHFLYNKNYTDALKCYFNVLSRDPEYKDIFVNAPLVIYEIPDKTYRGVVLDSLYNYNPNSFEVNNHLGAYYLIDKVDFDKAIKHLSKANAIKKNDLLVLKNLGVAYFNKGEIKLAETVFLNALQVAPNDKQLFQYIITVYKQQGNNKLAAEYEARLKQ